MEVLGHLIFELVKIFLLGSIYATLVFAVFKIAGYFSPNSWFSKVSQNKSKLWLFCNAIFLTGLFIYMFSYWGDHGLGDSARIPLGNNEEVKNIDWMEQSFLAGVKNNEAQEITMIKFLVVNDLLIGNYNNSFYDFKNSYFTHNLKSKELTEFKTSVEYNTYAGESGLPASDKLLSFGDNYAVYWGGWRFWLLP